MDDKEHKIKMTIAEIIEKAINDNSKRGLSTEAICQHAEFEIKQWLGKQGDSQQWQLKTEDMKNKFIYKRVNLLTKQINGYILNY